MGFLAPWFLAGIAALGCAVLCAPAATAHDHAAPLQLADVFRAAHAKLDQASAPALSASAFASRAAALLLVLAFANPFINRTAANMNADKLAAAGDRQFLQHARRNAPGRCEDAKRFPCSLRAGRRTTRK